MMEDRRDENSMCYWWPKIKDLGIPVPRTIEVKTSLNWPFQALLEMEKDKAEPSTQKEFRRLANALIEAATTINKDGPVFLRTDALSGKHAWKHSCFVSNGIHIMNNLYRLLEEQELMTMGFIPVKSFFVREYIPMYSYFTAFHGEMPINKERRYFIRNGKVECHHPYWPEASIHGRDLPDNWKKCLMALNHESKREIKFLTSLAETVGKDFPEWWSVDFSQAEAGPWYLIDMARGEDSFHWIGCPNVPEDQIGVYGE